LDRALDELEAGRCVATKLGRRARSTLDLLRITDRSAILGLTLRLRMAA
jgi:hypothetical protein